MFTQEFIGLLNEPDKRQALPQFDLGTDLLRQIIAPCICFNAARHRGTQRVSVSQVGQDRLCTAVNINGDTTYLLRQDLRQIPVDVIDQLQSAIEAINGSCQLTQKVLHIVLPNGFMLNYSETGGLLVAPV